MSSGQSSSLEQMVLCLVVEMKHITCHCMCLYMLRDLV